MGLMSYAIGHHIGANACKKDPKVKAMAVCEYILEKQDLKEFNTRNCGLFFPYRPALKKKEKK